MRQLEEIGRQHTIEARSGEPSIRQWIPDSPQEAEGAGVTDMDVLEAVDYFRTSRGSTPIPRTVCGFIGNAWVIAFDAFHLVEELLT